MGKRSDKAVSLYLSGYNCAQAVARAYSDVLGLDEEKASALVSGLGGGVGGQHEVCGAVTSATLVLGSLLGTADGDQETKHRIYARVQAVCKDFKREHSSIICRDLLVNAKKEDPSPKPCSKYIRSICALIDSSIGDKSEFSEK